MAEEKSSCGCGDTCGCGSHETKAQTVTIEKDKAAAEAATCGCGDSCGCGH
ncbi:hypothetical protein [Pseudoclavibacter caeni]|jgi:hypothetical protein|uniref:hypothetical protein n=1 Tax=Pseudoclavibacter caeni TaxID=908846 RepID=UPI0015CC98AE|nr:hypothetical protein [Pseudoclavibacter caeni]NYJ97436.1 hypothetical protein [Pseudoclavibacter caeni]